MHLIETSHLKTWASSKSAESRFPYIIKSLICAVISPKKLRMPSGDAVWMPGYDGELANTEDNRFIPKGFSVWELGTNSDFKDKANKDYEKRSRDKHSEKDEKQVGQIDRSKVVFIFATPLVWTDKANWIDQRKAECIWKDIIVIEGTDIQDWLETAPAVNLQFAAELGIIPALGLWSLDQAWNQWSHFTDPPTTEELVVADREEMEKELVSHLVDEYCTYTIRGDSPREAWSW